MSYKYGSKLVGSVFFAFFLASCGSSGGGSNQPSGDTLGNTPEQPSENTEDPGNVGASGPIDVFAADEILDVKITVADTDWSKLVQEGPQISDWGAACVFEGYNYYDSTVTINGQTVENVSVRKKGWIGSLTVLRPSLKLNFGREAFDGRTFHGSKRITLNNNHQDAATVKQCLAYQVFNDAGIHAPRCSFARVTAQGEELGIYTHVEAIKKPFLARTFGDDSGNLYEAQRDGEFNSSRLPYFQLKTNEVENDTSDLARIVDILESTVDAQLWGALEPYVALDQFITFAAVEALIGHTDGYTGFQNNTYIYHNPLDDRLHFIPWGTDQTFVTTYVTDRGTDVPASVMVGSELIQALWRNEIFRSRYDARMQELLDTVWDEAALKVELDRMAALVEADSAEIELVHNFIDERRQQILDEIDGGSRDWAWPLMGDIDSCPMPTPVQGTFDIRFGEMGPQGDFSLTYGDEVFLGESGFAGVDFSDGRYNVRMVSSGEGGVQFYIEFNIPEAFWRAQNVPFHSLETMGIGAYDQGGENWNWLGFVTDGSVTFERVGSSEGDIVRGSFSAAIVAPN